MSFGLSRGRELEYDGFGFTSEDLPPFSEVKNPPAVAINRKLSLSAPQVQQGAAAIDQKIEAKLKDAKELVAA